LRPLKLSLQEARSLPLCREAVGWPTTVPTPACSPPDFNPCPTSRPPAEFSGRISDLFLTRMRRSFVKLGPTNVFFYRSHCVRPRRDALIALLFASPAQASASRFPPISDSLKAMFSYPPFLPLFQEGEELIQVIFLTSCTCFQATRAILFRRYPSPQLQSQLACESMLDLSVAKITSPVNQSQAPESFLRA